MSLNLRKADFNDLDLLFSWVNDQEVRKNSISSAPISYEIHTIWFNKKMNSPDCEIFILEFDATPAGQIRFDYRDNGQIAEIAYSIASEFRGKNLGKMIISEGIKHVHAKSVIGYVKPENIKSHSIFKSLGFSISEGHVINDVALVKYFKNLHS